MGGSVVLAFAGISVDHVFQSGPVGGYLQGFTWRARKIICFRDSWLRQSVVSADLQTQTGASAVGESTTRAVVSGIILIVLTDGIFSVIYYYLGI